MECRDQSCTKRNSKFHRWEIHFGRFRRNTIESSWHSALIKGECVRQDKTVRETKTKQPIRFCDLTRSWDTNRNWFSSRNVREISSSKNRTTRLGQLYVFSFWPRNLSLLPWLSSSCSFCSMSRTILRESKQICQNIPVGSLFYLSYTGCLVHHS